MNSESREPEHTQFAPAERCAPDALNVQREGFLADASAVAMLEAMPGPAMVLNSCRQILTVNRELMELFGVIDLTALLGARPGEAVACVQASKNPGGCGTSEACSTCGAVNAILEAQGKRGRAVKECRIVTQAAPDGGALDFRVFANHMRFGDEDCVVLGLTDISGDKRRQVLERVFFHDLLNAVGGVHGLAEMLVAEEVDPDLESECKQDIHRLSSTVIEEIRSHREMLAAERGELKPHVEEVALHDLLLEVIHLYRHHSVATDRSIEFAAGEPTELRTDPNMLRRVVGNLIKNALEAIPKGATVTVGYGWQGNTLRLWVRNPGVIPRDIQLQIFQRSFSTKAASGRGIGTYSVRLFVERHLGGKVGFTSDSETGTEFHVDLPRVAGEEITQRAA